jgi:hypothetical protein
VVCDRSLYNLKPPEVPFATDYLIVTGNTPSNPDVLNRFFIFDQLIIDSSCNYYRMMEWKKISEKNKSKSWITGINGAYIAVF